MTDEKTPNTTTTTTTHTLEEHEITYVSDVMRALRHVSMSRRDSHLTTPSTRVEVDAVTFNIAGHDVPYHVTPSEFDEHGYTLNLTRDDDHAHRSDA